MTDEQWLMKSYRAMDDRRKREALVRMDRIAATHPARPAKKLRLVVVASNSGQARALGA